MASNITESAGFVTANMKPASGEQLDALWGQNVADNTGYVYFHEQLACTMTGIGVTSNVASLAGTHFGTVWFQKFPEHNFLKGTYTGTTNSNGVLVGRINGTTFFSHSGVGSQWKAGTAFSISHLTDGNWYEIGVTVQYSGAGFAQLQGLTFYYGASA